MGTQKKTRLKITTRKTIGCFFALLFGLALIQIYFVAQLVPAATSFVVNNTSAEDDSVFYKNIPISSSYNLWDNDPDVPQWMKDYLSWHKYKKRSLFPNEKKRSNNNDDWWKSERFLVIQCLENQDKRKCGGTADRLKPVPTLLRLAYKTRRILLIHWTRPALLEDFLVPPKGGLDWRIPLQDSFLNVLYNETNGRRFSAYKPIQQYATGDLELIRTRYQSVDPWDVYNANLEPGEKSFEQIFNKVWRIFFRPSNSVENIIQTELQQLQLRPGYYVSAHVRALYAVDERPVEHIRAWSENALRCASQLRPNASIFFTSDSDYATAHAGIYAAENGIVLKTHLHKPNPPLHLDKCKDWKKRPISDFYDTFIDLYLIALGGCVTFNKGGFGHWGLLIGGNIGCFIKQRTKFQGQIETPCEWKFSKVSEELPQSSGSPLFLDPM